MLLLPLVCLRLLASDDADSVSLTPENAAEFPLHRSNLYQLDPVQPVQTRPMTADELERNRLRMIDEVEEEFSAPPLVVARIASVPVMSGDSATQAVYRAERSLIRERARLADRMFRRGEIDAALTLMRDTERILQLVPLRIMALNRLAAYHYRLKQYKEGAVYARQAWDLDRTDLMSACNLAAILLTAEKVDEALDILLRIYGQAFDRPQFAFALHFNLACAYSMKGDERSAIQNLVLSAQIDPHSTLVAIGDPHLDGIRELPEFTRIRDALERLLTTPPPRQP